MRALHGITRLFHCSLRRYPPAKCQTLIQAPLPAQVIDKGIPTAGLLAQVLMTAPVFACQRAERLRLAPSRIAAVGRNTAPIGGDEGGS